MRCLGDTNVTTRWTLPSDPLYAACRTAVKTLRDRGDLIYIAPQILNEYWALATRPADANGLGLSVTQVAPRVRLLMRNFPMLPETPAVFQLWLDLVEAHGIVGRQVYDARIVALMQAHGITHILTFNGSHFSRFPGITVIDPGSV